jgi:hypothetical protein
MMCAMQIRSLQAGIDSPPYRSVSGSNHGTHVYGAHQSSNGESGKGLQITTQMLPTRIQGDKKKKKKKRAKALRVTDWMLKPGSFACRWSLVCDVYF